MVRAALVTAVAVAASVAPVPQLPPPSALAAFNASLRGTLVAPGDIHYTNASIEWNARFDSQKPYAVVFVAGDSDVALSLAFAKTWSLPLTARSGRHQVEGWSVCTGCLVIDVSRGYSSVNVDVVAQHAVVGAGVTIASLLNATCPLGWHTPCGSCSTVGAAGFVLGGGIGWTSRLYGLAVDNLVDIRVMLANGTVIEASANNSYSNLWWAHAGGGGGNFGIVLSFTLALHPLPARLLYAEFAYPWDVVANATGSYLALRGETRFLFYCLFVRPSTVVEPLVLLQGIWVGDLNDGYAALATLVTLARESNASGIASASIIETDYLTAHRLFEGRLGSRTGNKQKSAFVPATEAAESALVSAAALEIIRVALVAAPADVADHSAVYINSMGGAVNAVASDATAFPHRDALANFVIDAHWALNTTAPVALDWARRLYSSLADGGFLGPPSGSSLPTYVNYADDDLPYWKDAYYGSNYKRLQAAKLAADPNNTFTFPQAIQLPPATHQR